eukprot:1302218-Rhodomonas_salina.2
MRGPGCARQSIEGVDQRAGQVPSPILHYLLAVRFPVLISWCAAVRFPSADRDDDDDDRGGQDAEPGGQAAGRGGVGD